MGGWTGIRGGIASAAGAALIVAAQPQDAAAQGAQKLERVEVTGSSVRRIDAESAVPMQVITKDDIRRSGATSVVDLFRQLPVMQGQLGHTSSLGGATAGYANVSIHGFDDVRTLVLLNGHRVTSFGGQTITGFAASFDINALPLAAIERIEILTDGASAVYGSDAIAGVVNVITKRGSTDGDVTVGVSVPRGGAREKRVSITKGFGSLGDDGFNALLSLSHEERSELNSTKRPFARSAQMDFTHEGRRFRNTQLSPVASPANVYGYSDFVYSNPLLLASQPCPASHARVIDPAYGDDYCGYDYASDIQIYPEQKRSSAFLSLNAKPSADHTLYADLMLSRTRTTTRTAPALGSGEIAPGTPFHDTYFAPYGITDTLGAMVRLSDLGRRANEDTADFFDLTVGQKGRWNGWDYGADLSHSESRVRSNIAGSVGTRAVESRIASGLLDPFRPPGGQPGFNWSSIDYRGPWDGGTAKLDAASLRASRDLAELPGGPLVLGTGINAYRERFRYEPGAFAQGQLDDPVLGTPAATPGGGDIRAGESFALTPYSVSRTAVGAFAELVLPVARELELSGSLRHDRYSDFGNTTNLKGAFRFTPSPQWLLRGSLGTGFHAPSGPQTSAPRQSYGVTAGFYNCSTNPGLQAVAAALGASCLPDQSQYSQVAVGNTELEAERVSQGSLGLRFEPNSSFSVGADWWFNRIRQQLGAVSESAAFANPQAYPTLWAAVDDDSGGQNLARVTATSNLGKSYTSGVDFDASGRVRGGGGEWGSRLALTILLRQRVQTQPDGPYHSAIGNFGELDYVSFRWIARWTNAVKLGDWTHALTVNARSGYTDRAETAQPIDAAGNPVGDPETVRLNIKRFFSADWQTDWAMRSNWRLTLGVLNLFDRDPPLSLASGGLNKGQQVGFDDRYYDPRGRTFYANVSYKF